MNNIFGSGAINLYLFLYLLPGILGALVYEYVVEQEPREALDRIATALVLALFGALASTLFSIGALAPHFIVHSDTPPDKILEAFLQPKPLLISTLISASVAILFGTAQNHGWIYGALRFLKITKKTGRSDVWQQTFYLMGDRWISLEFKDGRRLIGWPQRFSSSGQPRALLINEATWHAPDQDGGFAATDVHGPGVYVANFDEVVSMEFLT